MVAAHSPFRGGALSSFEESVLRWITPDGVAELLRELVQQRSDFPPGDTRSVVETVIRHLNKVGAAAVIESRQPHQPSVLARLGSSEEKTGLLLHAHLDTVPAGELNRWQCDPYAGLVQDGRLYGRGAGDDKGSAAAMLAAVIALVRAGTPLQRPLLLALVADEESGGLEGTKWLHDRGLLQTEALVVGEQTANQVAVAERVACGIDLIIYGKSAHGAMPWAGENAVLKAAQVLNWFEKDLFPELSKPGHPYLPAATLNIGKIGGGIQWSIVPEMCKIEMDRRLLPGETREAAVEQIRRSLERFNGEVEPLRYDLISTGEVAANIDTSPEDPLVQLACQALRDCTGQERLITGYQQTSDGRWFARDGMPIILFGPGDPALAHAANEYVTLDELVEAARFYTLFALRWLNR